MQILSSQSYPSSSYCVFISELWIGLDIACQTKIIVWNLEGAKIEIFKYGMFILIQWGHPNLP